MSDDQPATGRTFWWGDYPDGRLVVTEITHPETPDDTDDDGRPEQPG